MINGSCANCWYTYGWGCSSCNSTRCTSCSGFINETTGNCQDCGEYWGFGHYCTECTTTACTQCVTDADYSFVGGEIVFTNATLKNGICCIWEGYCPGSSVPYGSMDAGETHTCSDGTVINLDILNCNPGN